MRRRDGKRKMCRNAGRWWLAKGRDPRGVIACDCASKIAAWLHHPDFTLHRNFFAWRRRSFHHRKTSNLRRLLFARRVTMTAPAATPTTADELHEDELQDDKAFCRTTRFWTWPLEESNQVRVFSPRSSTNDDIHKRQDYGGEVPRDNVPERPATAGTRSLSSMRHMW